MSRRPLLADEAPTAAAAVARLNGRTATTSSPAVVPLRVQTLVAAGFAYATVAVAFQTIGHLLNALALDYGVYNLDADVDGNMLAWASSSATFAAGLGAYLSAYVMAGRRPRLLALAAVLVLFSADDIVALHEHLGQAVVRVVGVDADYGRLIWPPLYLPLMLFAVVELGRLALHGPDAGRRPLAVGLVMLLAAVPAEMLWALWHVAGGEVRTTPDAIEVALEEGLELGGWILVATGLAAVALVSLGREEPA